MSVAAAPRSRALIWWQAVRPFAFSASATPVIVGSAAAFHEGVFQPLLFLVTLAAAMCIHAATNLTNDYYDHVRGVDAGQPIGPGGAIQQDLLTPRAILNGALVLFMLAGVLGIWLVALRGWIILLIGALSMLAGYAYTGGPVPLGYVGLGDVVVFVFMGLVTNLRDLDNDRAKGKRTLATFIGAGATRAHYLVLLALAYTAVIAAVALSTLPAPTLLVLLTVPAALRAWAVVRTERESLALTLGGIRTTAQLHARVGALLAAGLVLGRFVSW